MAQKRLSLREEIRQNNRSSRRPRKPSWPCPAPRTSCQRRFAQLVDRTWRFPAANTSAAHPACAGQAGKPTPPKDSPAHENSENHPGITRLLDKLEATPGASQAACPEDRARFCAGITEAGLTSAGRPGQTDGRLRAQAMESLPPPNCASGLPGWSGFAAGLG